MPINVSFLDEEKRVISMQMNGMVDSNELSDIVVTQVIDYAEINPSLQIHAIFDVREAQWEFAQYIQYIKNLSERRKNRAIPTNITSHFVGTSLWLSSLRTWMEKQYSQQFNGFTDVEQALAYIKDLEDKQS